MIHTLNVAQTGLRTSQVQVENVMNNIANENTKGYKTRDVVTQEAAHIDARVTGRGVAVLGVDRETNVYMYQNLIKENGKEAELKKLDVLLDDMESIFHETDDSGLSADLNRYFHSIENLKTSPHNTIYKNDLKNNAKVLVDTIQTLYKDIENREKTTLKTTKDMVVEVNNILHSIGDISQQIVDAPVVTNDLLDKRDALEKDLSQYVDVEIFRENNYELKIAGVTAVRFDTNVHKVNLAENYIAQKDYFVKENTLDKDSIIDKNTWGDKDAGNGAVQEEQTILVQGDAEGQVSFLGHLVAGSADGDTTEQTVDNIINDKADIISEWNSDHLDQEIDDIVKVSSNEIKIIYKDTEGDVIPLAQTQSSGITFAKSLESTKGDLDKVTFRFNNTYSVEVYAGESITMDWNGDGNETTDTVDKDNILRALAYKINSLSDMGDKITVYNGDYSIDKDGNKVPMKPTDEDHYLVMESKLPGEIHKFDGEIIVTDEGNRTVIDKNSTRSKEAQNDIHLEIYDDEVTISSGILKPMIENIDTNNSNNFFQEYKNKLDQFAKQLVDLTSMYIENDDGSYVYGRDAVIQSDDYDKRKEINIFTGEDVKSLQFHKDVINNITQEKLDYLSSLQWKDDIDFDGTGQNNTTFSKYYQEIRSKVSDDHENIIFRKEAQSSVVESLQLTYDKLVKVDKDEQMVDLIKFQSAYEANAKLITAVDEMLKILLGMKR